MRYLLVLILLLPLFGASQTTNLRSDVVPEVALSFKISDRLKISTKVEMFNQVFNNTIGYTYSGIESQYFLAYKMNPFLSMAGGYQLISKPEHVFNHRYIQQIAMVQKYMALKIGHRFRTDQTLKGEKVDFRIRYRLSAEIPLQGHQLDVQEFFSAFSLEPLILAAHKEGFIEGRMLAVFGYRSSIKSKIQTAFEYRHRANINKTLEQRFIYRISFYYSI